MTKLSPKLSVASSSTKYNTRSVNWINWELALRVACSFDASRELSFYRFSVNFSWSYSKRDSRDERVSKRVKKLNWELRFWRVSVLSGCCCCLIYHGLAISPMRDDYTFRNLSVNISLKSKKYIFVTVFNVIYYCDTSDILTREICSSACRSQKNIWYNNHGEI